METQRSATYAKVLIFARRQLLFSGSEEHDGCLLTSDTPARVAEYGKCADDPQLKFEVAVASSNRFDALDGMRGIAALAVLSFHICQSIAPWLVPHGYLAVDLFFALSGFVIEAAYRKRIALGLGAAKFMRLRAVRLYPLVILGALIGAAGYFRGYDHGTLGILMVTAMALIPTTLGSVAEDRPVIAANPPSWSILFELIANLIFALFGPRLSNKAVATIIFISLLGLLANLILIGNINAGSLCSQFWGGFPRVGFSFFAGVIVCRLRNEGYFERVRLPFFFIAALLIASLSAPIISWDLNAAYEIVVVTALYPMLIALGSNVSLRGGTFLCAMAGELSYPAYILQGGITPHLRSLNDHLGIHGAAAGVLVIVIISAYLVFCWLALKVYDEPIRRYLSKRGQPIIFEKPAQSAP